MLDVILNPQILVLILFLVFGILAAIGVPVAFALGLSSVTVILLDPKLMIWPFFQRSFYALDSFVLLAVPLFMFTGVLMNASQITDRLIDFSRCIVGPVRGGLAHVNIVCSMIFAGVSGSTNADTAGEGSIIIPAMIKEGYPPSFSVAITAASSVMGVIIPPSLLMVVWSSITETSVAGLFLGGVVPGILIGISQMIVTAILAKKHNFPRIPFPGFKELLATSKHGLFALGAPVLIIGGILAGYFTPTEAAVAAILYCLFFSVVFYRKLTFAEFVKACWETARITSLALFCVAMASIFGWLIAYYRVPRMIMEYISIDSPVLLLMFISGVMLLFGTFMDALPAMAILAPLFLPLTKAAGIHPVHFGVVSVVALALGFITPPYGLSLLIASKIAGIPMTKALKDTMLFFTVALIVILLMIFIPKLVLGLPQLIAPNFL